MYWRVVVIDDSRFCIVGTMDLTFSECRDLSARRNGYIRIPHRMLENIGSFEVEPTASYSVATVRGEHMRKITDKGEQSILHVVIRGEEELQSLRATGRFREWDADLRKTEV